MAVLIVNCLIMYTENLWSPLIHQKKTYNDEQEN